MKNLQVKAASPTRRGADAFRRQSAEARRRQMARQPAARADPRRADARRGRRRQGGGPQAHPPARRRRGMATLLISSDLPEVLAMSDRILVMRGGRIAGELSRARGDAGKGAGAGDPGRRRCADATTRGGGMTQLTHETPAALQAARTSSRARRASASGASPRCSRSRSSSSPSSTRDFLSLDVIRNILVAAAPAAIVACGADVRDRHRRDRHLRRLAGGPVRRRDGPARQPVVRESSRPRRDRAHAAARPRSSA